MNLLRNMNNRLNTKLNSFSRVNNFRNIIIFLIYIIALYLPLLRNNYYIKSND